MPSIFTLETKAIILWDRAAAFVKQCRTQHENMRLAPREEYEGYNTISALLDEQLRLSRTYHLTRTSSASTSTAGSSNGGSERMRRILLVQSILGAAVVRLNSWTSGGNNTINNEKRQRSLEGAKTVLKALVGLSEATRSSPHDVSRMRDTGFGLGWLNPVISVSFRSFCRKLAL